MRTEIWSFIEEFGCDYEVSTLGRIRSLDRIVVTSTGVKINVSGKIISQQTNRGGYLQCKIKVDGRQKTICTHRLIAKAFIPNPENKREVNHIDGDKTNNNVDNLEWCTPSENIKHSYDIGIRVQNFKGKFGSEHNRSKAVVQYDMNMNRIAIFGSMREAFRETNIRHIWESCNNLCSHAGGYKWEYLNKEKD